MSQTNRIEIELDDRRFLALQNEAERLGVDMAQIVTRAASAWISEMADNSVLSTASPVATATN
jgi:pheromone shutdown protein TraB